MVASSLHSIFLLTTFSASPGFQHPCEKYFQSATSIRESSKTSSSALYLFFSSSQTSLKIEKIRSICYFLLGNKRHIEFPTRKIRPLVISVLKIKGPLLFSSRKNKGRFCIPSHELRAIVIIIIVLVEIRGNFFG